MFGGGCSCCCYEGEELKSTKIFSPDPEKFKIKRTYQVGKALVAEIIYSNCTNFEGHKILVYSEMSNITEKTLYRSKSLDPHFVDKSSLCPSPIARFKPTERGWALAIEFAKTCLSRKDIPIESMNLKELEAFFEKRFKNRELQTKEDFSLYQQFAIRTYKVLKDKNDEAK
ncbi:MAG: hypothetical protein KAX49_15305 [Halanaerobiales bacterium]|nr:hypothetical protein [Halanaerobiales bacterium]